MMSCDLSETIKIQWGITCWALTPGRFMHDDWWVYLGISQWRAAYSQDSKQARTIDIYIRRLLLDNYTDISFPLNDIQHLFYSISNQWIPIITALGLLKLKCMDYLLRREYRQKLAQVMDYEQINQLIAIWREGNSEPVEVPETLLKTAQCYGVHTLLALVRNDPFYSLIRLQLPRCTMSEDIGEMDNDEFIVTKIRRLGRFL